MRIQRLRINQLRQFRTPFELNDLEPGLNLFAGPNECGKSTLARAIRAAFFERHKSTSVADLQPWGDSSASPEIDLDFEVGGKYWRLSKSFLRRKRCDLHIDGQHISGDDAEDRLSELLGYQLPSRGASKAELWGIPGLLWIEQGSGQELRDSVEHASDHLQSALSSMVGEIASSSGDWLLEKVKAARAELLTPSGKPARDYAATIRAREQLQQEVAQLAEAIASYQSSVDRLGQLKQEQQEDASRPWEVYEEKLRLTQQKLSDITELEQLNLRDHSARESAEHLCQLMQERLAEEDKNQQRMSERVAEVENRRLRQQQLTAASEPLNQAVAQMQARWRQANEDCKQVRKQQQRKSVAESVEYWQRQHSSLHEQTMQADHVREQLTGLTARWQELSVDETQLQTLATESNRLETINIRQQAVATGLTLQLREGQSVLMDGVALSGDSQHRLIRSTQIDIDGVGSFTIQPGGEDLSELARQQQALHQKVAGLLESMSVASLQDAQYRASQAADLKRDIDLHRARLKDVAPQGIDTLRQQCLDAEQQLDKARQQLQQLPEPECKVNTVSLQDSEDALALAEDSLKQAESALRQHETEIKLAQQALLTAESELETLQQRMSSEEFRLRRSQIEAQWQQQAHLVAQLSKDIQQRAGIIEAAQPDLLRSDVERYGQAAQRLRDAARDREQKIRDLQIQLQALGAQGMEEDLSSRQIELQQTEQRYQQQERRAEALELLLTLLNEQRQALTMKLQAPLQKHLQHYLNILFPGARLSVDDKLVPKQLIRRVAAGEEFSQIDDLSFGAREQMGIISRLAYADLLLEAGKPTLILLDDVLVHTDAQRLEAMKRVLYDAARRHQLLMFTCHPEKWRDMAAIRDITSAPNSEPQYPNSD